MRTFLTSAGSSRRLPYASALWSDEFRGDDARCEALTQDGDRIAPAQAPDGLYYVVFAAASPDALPQKAPQLSLFADREESEHKRIEAQFREVMRLDGLLKDRDAAADRQTLHIRHLEELVAYRERIVEERDAQLVAVNAAREWHENALAAERERCAALTQKLAQCEAELAALQAELAGSARKGLWR